VVAPPLLGLSDSLFDRMSHLLAVTAHLAAAGCVFLLLLNRVLIHMRDGALKKTVILLVFVMLGLAAIRQGLTAEGSQSIALPLVVLGLVAVGEIRRAMVRRRYRAAGSVTSNHPPVSLRSPDTTTDLETMTFEVPIPHLNGSALTVIHMSDFHIDDTLPLQYYHSVVEQANGLQPDLVFITGDFVTDTRHTGAVTEVFSRVRSNFGAYAVLGNHDYWADAEVVRSAVREAGVVLLGNSCRRVSVGDGRWAKVCGCEHPWGRRLEAVGLVSADEPAFILTHTPDNIYRLSRTGALAVFAGHYHGGQLKLPLLGPLVVPSVYGRRFDHGHFLVNGTHLFVTGGVGAVAPAIRIFCRPDMFVVRFKGSGRLS
jgi:predicted MPP superfamily phosphohydrolase